MDASLFPVKIDNGASEGTLAYVDLSGVIENLKDVYDNGDKYENYKAAIAEPVQVQGEGVLYLTRVSAHITYDDVITYLDIEGYYLR